MLKDSTSKAFGIKDCLNSDSLFPADLKFLRNQKKEMTLGDL